MSAPQRAEDIRLSAESLERQLIASHAADSVLRLVGDLVDAAWDLHNELAAVTEQHTSSEGER